MGIPQDRQQQIYGMKRMEELRTEMIQLERYLFSREQLHMDHWNNYAADLRWLQEDLLDSFDADYYIVNQDIRDGFHHWMHCHWYTEDYYVNGQSFVHGENVHQWHECPHPNGLPQ